MRFNEAIKVYLDHIRTEKEPKTLRGYEKDLLNFCLFIGNPIITHVTDTQVIAYINGMRELGWKQNTVMLKCVCFRGFFKYWKSKGYPVMNPEQIPHVKREYSEPRIADENRIKKFLNVCGDDSTGTRAKALMLILRDTGARISEICSINMDIDTENYELIEGRKIWSYIVKTRKSQGKKPHRRIFWYEETNKALKEWIRKRNGISILIDKEALFVGCKSWRMGKRMNNYNAALTFRRICKKAGFKKEEYINPHSLRHLFGNSLGQQGANNSIISDLMGHASLASSFVYTHLNDSQQKAAHARFIKRR